MILPTGGKQKRLAAPGRGGALLQRGTRRGAPFLERSHGIQLLRGEERRTWWKLLSARGPRRHPPAVVTHVGLAVVVIFNRRVGPAAARSAQGGFSGSRFGLPGSRVSGPRRAGGPAAALKNRRRASARRNRAGHLRTEGKELGSVRIRSGLSCLAPMSGLLLLWGSSGSRLSLFHRVSQSSLVLQGLIESLKPTQQW